MPDAETEKTAPIRLERDGNVAVMILSNPPLNLFGEDAWGALISCIDEVESSDARALVWLEEGAASAAFGSLIPVVQCLEELPIPTLAIVHGLCLTAGLEISLGCDMIWASESAKFGLVEAVVGLTPGAGGTQRMAERAGPARAREFVMSQGIYDAATLERWNVVNRVVGDDELLDKGMAFAQRLANGPTKAHGATKRIVRACLRGGVEEADRVTAEVAGGLFETEDLQRAVRSFLSEGPGKATFEGR